MLLKKEFALSLTGTPIRNEDKEMLSHLQFLGYGTDKDSNDKNDKNNDKNNDKYDNEKDKNDNDKNIWNTATYENDQLGSCIKNDTSRCQYKIT